jgi:O-glycosyl hydrolase
MSYADPKKVIWLADVSCHVCGGEVNSWDKRCSRALDYKHITCEECIAKEYGVTVEELRDTMKEHFGLVPCPGI